MDVQKEKKNLIIKTWKHCKSLTKSPPSLFRKSKSWKEQTHQRVAPEGCFSVYVGPERERFIVKAKCANHPLFIMLLEEAASEFGFISDGPIVLPCAVAVFFKVLAEIDGEKEVGKKRGFKKSRSYHLLGSPSRLVAMNQFQFDLL